jgi:hypothetical protein
MAAAVDMAVAAEMADNVAAAELEAGFPESARRGGRFLFSFRTRRRVYGLRRAILI